MYRFRSPEGDIVESSLSELARNHGLAYESVKALAYGRQAFYRDWQCLNPRRRSERVLQPGCRHVLHRWRHPQHGEQVMTAAELTRFDPRLSRKCLFLLTNRGIQTHMGWQWVEEVANWPRRLIAVVDPSGAVSDRVPLDLLREEGLSVADVDALLAARPSGGWSPYPEAAAAA